MLHNERIDEPVLGVFGWGEPGGEAELAKVLSEHEPAYYLDHLAMYHPPMVSYPLPRILWLKNSRPGIFGCATRILQPKDYLYFELTGLSASDPYTWRGLAHTTDGTFHPGLLADYGLDPRQLPELYSPWNAPGAVSPSAAERFGIEAGVPVYMGCNDFFAALLGIGIDGAAGTPAAGMPVAFDVAGSSEHVGIVTNKPTAPDKVISGPFFRDFVEYGVTANSGKAVSWARKVFQDAATESDLSSADLPLFLPYLDGERAPIFDPQASGVFFGLSGRHSRAQLLRSVFEGVVFSLYHVWTTLGADAEKMICGGAASRDDRLNQLKADLFALPLEACEEVESSAFGAAICAAVGHRWFDDPAEAQQAWVKSRRIVEPRNGRTPLLRERFEIYRGLYPVLRKQYSELHSLRSRYE